MYRATVPSTLIANSARLFAVCVVGVFAQTAHAQVPTINIQETCRAAAGVMVNLMGGSTTQNDVQICLETENKAREQLIKDWSTFQASDREGCIDPRDFWVVPLGDICSAAKSPLFNDFVSDLLDLPGDVEAERPCGLYIDCETQTWLAPERRDLRGWRHAECDPHKAQRVVTRSPPLMPVAPAGNLPGLGAAQPIPA
jgi:hypothetical protein